MKIFITSGGTKIPIDRVRNISNMSKGTFGAKIAYELLTLGHEVFFFKAEGSASPVAVTMDLAHNGWTPKTLQTWYDDRSKLMSRYCQADYSSFDDYAAGLKKFLTEEEPDVILLAAAVSDYGVENFVDGKVRSRTDDFQIKLKPLPKLIGKIKQWSPRSKLVGFKLLVDSTEEELITAARKSISDNGCDMVVANDLSDMRKGKHSIRLVWPNNDVFTFTSETDQSNPNYLAHKVAHYASLL